MLNQEEIQQIKKALGRQPTEAEIVAFDIEGSEHTSYRSSKKYLKLLPTKGPHVILGPKEDAGIIRLSKLFAFWRN